MKTLQQIYDFCKLDRTYRAYYDLPDMFQMNAKQYKYYNKSLSSRGTSRAGTYIFSQAKRQLHRFLGIKDWQEECIRFHVDYKTFRVVDYQKCEYAWETVYITTSIGRNGVRITFTHPFNRMSEITYYAHSHYPYTQEGVRLDVIKYINRHLLFSPGRYRELQIQYEVTKERFPEWYKKYKESLQNQYNREYYDMLEKYEEKPHTMDFEESYSLLLAGGMFYDFNCDEYERDELACQFMEMSNR